MEKLPDEVIGIIADFLPERGLASYATLSPRWQRAIERRTFSTIRVNSTDEDIEALSRIIINSPRLNYLGQLYYTVVVSFNEASVKPRNQQQARFSAAFTEALRKLFFALAGDTSRDKNRLSSKNDTGGILLQIYGVGSALDTWDQPKKYLSGHIGLINYEDFPLAESVTQLEIRDSDRKIALRTGIELSTRLPNLCILGVETNEQDLGKINTQAALLRENRQGLAAALNKTDFLEKFVRGRFTLTTDDLEATDLLFKPRFVFPNCHENTDAPSYDPLSVAIRTLSQNLTSLNLTGTFDDSLFWPSEVELSRSKDTKTWTSPYWPHLKNLTVKLGICHLNGGRYFTTKPNATARRGSWPPPLNLPCEETMQPLFASWAMALSQMPFLDSATIWFHVEMMMPIPGFEPPEQRIVDKWVVGFQAPGVTPDPTIYTFPETAFTAVEMQSPRLIFERTDGWRPWKTTMADLHEMAKQRFPGRDLVELDVSISNEVTRI